MQIKGLLLIQPSLDVYATVLYLCYIFGALPLCCVKVISISGEAQALN